MRDALTYIRQELRSGEDKIQETRLAYVDINATFDLGLASKLGPIEGHIVAKSTDAGVPR